MTKERAYALQEKFMEIVTAGMLDVSVGLFTEEGGEWGVSITSRQADIYVANGGPVVPQ